MTVKRVGTAEPGSRRETRVSRPLPSIIGIFLGASGCLKATNYQNKIRKSLLKLYTK